MRNNLHSRKINFVQDFLRIQNEAVIRRFEDMLRQEQLKLAEADLSYPMSLEELNTVIDQAEKDDRNGRLTNADDLKKEIDNWE
ncbi:hypothetical protein SAMN04488505_102828 [Chitinophaga rupis]|uniref:Addiction module component n=1 Tax=Chitinophaga rupis TaxID=573321 RepID=A0A1H7S7K6_9BACT|nr:hypothetical protein [Chitinophaga rupis]SEL67714.1 hypothetical protein SAMN04488505_102828 [Chitinophaga rupis]